MDAPKLDYRKEPKRPADTLGITAVVLAAMPMLVIGTVMVAMLFRRLGVALPSVGGGVLLIAFWIALVCGFLGLVLGLVAVVSRSRSRRMGLIAIGLVVAALAALTLGK